MIDNGWDSRSPVYLKMSRQRRDYLNSVDNFMTPEELTAGYHFCPDWDYLLVGPEDPEKEGCTCD